LDLVITVDTMVAHLAGALGIEVWTILQSNADWRWMLNRGDTPWYPTMRLFRQKRPGRWDEPLAKIVRELRNLSAGGPWQSGSSRIQVINR
jgi:ADP-heptose:LPS heptosyltransferase